MSGIIIDLARICIPYPTGFSSKGETVGIKVLGYDRLAYDFFKDMPNSDDVERRGCFYDIVSQAYNIDLGKMPQVRPYVSWVDWNKKNGGVLVNCNKETKEEILKNCNTLIVPREEQEFLVHLHLNMARSRAGDFMFNWKKTVPERFIHIQDSKVRDLMQKIAFPESQKVR